MEVQRPPQRPRLRQLAPFPERGTDVLPRDPLHPRCELQLGRAHHLRVDAADLAHDLDQPLGGRALGEVVARRSPSAQLVPRAFHGTWRYGAAVSR